MKYTLKKSSSAYIVTVTYDADDTTAAKDKVLKSYQKDVKISGFRPGHAPMNLVEQQVNPQYLEVAIKEQIITDQLRKMVEEKKDVQWIGNPHSIDWKDGEITYTLDVYPEVHVLNDDWKKVAMKAITPAVTDEQRDEVWSNFTKQYADYQDVEVVGAETVTTAQLSYHDKDGNELHTKRSFVGKEDIEKDAKLGELLIGKKKDDTVELKYTKKDIPANWEYKKDETKPVKLIVTISDIKEQVVPEFTREKIISLFGEEAQPQNEQELKDMITESVKVENYNNALMEQTEKVIDELKQKSLEVAIPQTIVDQETSERLKSMQERFGGEENFKKYLEQMGEEQQKEMMNSIRDAAKQSLEKFMILQKYVELLELEVDWKKQLDAEHKIYEKLTGEKVRSSDKL
jgi:trigger factor